MPSEILKNDKEILFKNVEDRAPENYELFLKAESVLLEFPVELELSDSFNEKKIVSGLSKVDCCNVGTIEAINVPVCSMKIADRVVSSMTGYTGAYGTKRSKIINISQGLPSEKACFIGLGGRILKTIHKAEIELGHKILVVGQGVVGQIASQIAKIAGADVLAADTNNFRLDIANKSGMETIDLKPNGLVSRIHDFSDGKGVDIILVCCLIRDMDLWTQLLNALRLGGKLILMYSQDVNLQHNMLNKKDIDIAISLGYEMEDDARITSPFGYVRWNLQRNMLQFKNMLLKEQISTHLLITQRFLIERNQSLVTIPFKSDNNQLGLFFNFI